MLDKKGGATYHGLFLSLLACITHVINICTPTVHTSSCSQSGKNIS